ncbi:MAG: NUDIX domain-containing protein [Planktomarina sp.]|nr:NUDIX domain-containing protein [Planktomarina sp.]
MTNVFLFGTLCWPPLLKRVAGQTCPQVEPAVLDGFSVTCAKGHSFPAIHESVNEKAKGLLLRDCDEHVLLHLDHYESGFGYQLRPINLQTPHGIISAKVYLPPRGIEPGGPWVLKNWEREHGQLALEAALEVMAVQGKMSAAEMMQRYPMMLVRANARINARKDASPRSKSALALDDIEVHSRHRPYINFFAVEEAVISVPKFSGGKMKNLKRAGFVGADAAIVLPYDPKTDRVLLIEQFRFGPFLRDDPNPWMMEPIAGRIDPKEEPEQTAYRESLEEAGLVLYEVFKVHSGYASPGASTDYFHIFIGLADIEQNSAILGGLPGEAEDIKGHVMSFEEFFAMLQAGELPVSPLALAGYWLASNRPRLRRNS